MTPARTAEPGALRETLAEAIRKQVVLLRFDEATTLDSQFHEHEIELLCVRAANAVLDSDLVVGAADRAEIDRLAAQVEAMRAERDEALRRAKVEKDSADMYANAWVRELGGKLFPKRFHIDACVKTTRWMRERSDRLAVIEAEQKAAALVAEYGPSNEMVAARIAARSALGLPEPEGESR